LPNADCIPGGSPQTRLGSVRDRRYVRNTSGLVIGDDGEAGKELMVMTDQTKRICANVSCFCYVPNGQEYCGDGCRQVGSENVEIACHCDHWACLLNAEFFFQSTGAEPTANDRSKVL